MNSSRQIKILLLLLLAFINVNSQESSSKDPFQFKAGVNYNTGLNYYGRTDSLNSSGFFPLAEAWFNESFYINAAPVFVNNKVSSFEYAGTVAATGFQFNADNKWLGNLYVVKPFYKENSDLVQSALKAQTGFTLTRFNSLLNITAGADLKFSENTDAGVTGGLDHIFRYQLNDKSVLVINPSAYINAGTQRFSKSYLKKNSDFLFFPGSQQLVTESTEKFSILSYEFSLPVIYAVGKCQVQLLPAYVIPQNLIKVESRPDLSEQGKNMFYMTLGAKLIL